MSKQSSFKGGMIQSETSSGKLFSSLSNNELKELMTLNGLEDIYYLISDYHIDAFDLSLLKYEELISELKIKNLHQRNRLIKFINKEISNQCNKILQFQFFFFICFHF